MASITKIGLGVDPRNKSGCLGSVDGGTVYCPSASNACFTPAQKMQLIKMNSMRPKAPQVKGKDIQKIPPQGVGVL